MRDLLEPALVGLILAYGALVLGLVYFLPSVVVLIRRPSGLVGAVIAINVCLGWTFLGWVASLALSLAGGRAPRPLPVSPRSLPPQQLPLPIALPTEPDGAAPREAVRSANQPVAVPQS